MEFIFAQFSPAVCLPCKQTDLVQRIIALFRVLLYRVSSKKLPKIENTSSNQLEPEFSFSFDPCNNVKSRNFKRECGYFLYFYLHSLYFRFFLSIIPIRIVILHLLIYHFILDYHFPSRLLFFSHSSESRHHTYIFYSKNKRQTFCSELIALENYLVWIPIHLVVPSWILLHHSHTEHYILPLHNPFAPLA